MDSIADTNQFKVEGNWHMLYKLQVRGALQFVIMCFCTDALENCWQSNYMSEEHYSLAEVWFVVSYQSVAA